jgi:hypothetical protein
VALSLPKPMPPYAMNGPQFSPRFQLLHDSLVQGSENHVVTNAFNVKPRNLIPPNVRRQKQ